MQLKSLCVYCGSSPGVHPAYLETARALGLLLASEKITLVYGGAKVGLMGALADSALAAGGEVIGVMPELLIAKEVAHEGLTRLWRVGSMHERKLKMAELADAFCALPGGVGTLEEIFEVFTWAQLGYHHKPCAFLDIRSYYAPLFRFLDHMAAQRFIKTQQLASLIRAENLPDLLRQLRAYEPVFVEKWLDRAAPQPRASDL